jgi:hypothetical protein
MWRCANGWPNPDVTGQGWNYSARTYRRLKMRTTTLLRNFGIQSPTVVVSYPGRVESSATHAKNRSVLVYNLNLVYLKISNKNCQIFQTNKPTRCKDLSSLLLDVYLQLNMFRASSRLSSGAQQLQ